MKLTVKKGRTSLLVKIFVQDSSKSTGVGLTGLTSGSAGLICYRARDDDGNAGGTQLSLSAGTRGTWSSGGFVEKDSTNMPGIYELGLDNAGLVTGSETVVYMLSGATNMAPVALEIQLVAYDPQSASLGIFITQLSESYAALHSAPSLQQILLEMRAHLCEKSVSGTTLTIKQLDGATTAETFTLNDAVSPTSITRAS